MRTDLFYWDGLFIILNVLWKPSLGEMTFRLDHRESLRLNIWRIRNCWNSRNRDSKSLVVQVAGTFPNSLKRAKIQYMEHHIRFLLRILHSEPLSAGQLNEIVFSTVSKPINIGLWLKPEMFSGLKSSILIPNFSNRGIIIAKIHCIFFALLISLLTQFK